MISYDESTHSFPSGTGPQEALLIYDLDTDADVYIKMDYLWNTGSGKRDYRVLIPEAKFSGKELTYVTIL